MNPQLSILTLTNRYPARTKPYAGWYVAAHEAAHKGLGHQVHLLTYFTGVKAATNLQSVFHFLLGMIRAMFLPFDVVHAHWLFPSGFIGVLFSLIRRLPTLITSHGAYIHEFDQLGFISQHLVRFALNRADIIVAVGQGHAGLIEEIAPQIASKIRIIDMGIQIPQDILPKREARLQLGLPLDKQIVMFIGNLETVKGPDILVETAAVCQDRLPSVEFILVGRGTMETELKEERNSRKLQDSVRFVGAVPHDEVYTWLFAADVIIVPSRREPFGLIAIEAMACARPVLAADVGELSLNIKHGVNGLLFPVDDVGAIVANVINLLEDEALQERLALEGREFAANYDYRQKASEILELYRELVSIH